MRRLLISLSIVLCTGMASAQDDCPCCTEAHGHFDFWLGDWVVFDTSGTQIGENLIQKLEDNCILNEHWRGSSGFTGRSYNYYDQSDSTWNQLWIDNQGSQLKLKGHGDGRQMSLQSELLPGKKVDWYRNRITWTLNSDDSVTQKWDILDKEGNILQTIFEGIYRKRNQ